MDSLGDRLKRLAAPEHMENSEDPTPQADASLSAQSSPAYPLLPGGLLPFDGSWHVWETAYKGACRRIDELLAEVAYLHMELASSEARNLCLTRENQRVNLTLKHLVPWASVTPPTSIETSDTDGDRGRAEEKQDEENKENIQPAVEQTDD
ncbi:mitochondrial-processing peptidase subunit alpha protein [Purpureocillium lavendulum]|uniref:Mitochondrial-processing peptidase subunit alpha protein n=1 Tax=Purpureocillium lavendulum TaxID=1247861 RepID=A0AB34FBG7_9HYPO|nr:mitochondrial-processing peptidase subunit alpha protein [Purpureocillium lavendulum]